jgi:hypothetical protein
MALLRTMLIYEQAACCFGPRNAEISRTELMGDLQRYLPISGLPRGRGCSISSVLRFIGFLTSRWSGIWAPKFLGCNN